VEKPRVLITRRLALAPDSVLGAGIEIDQHDSEEALERRELLRRVREVSALLAVLGDRVDRELLDAAPRLRIVANHAVGYDNVDVPACTARGVWVTNTPDVLTDATADLTWALILALARRVREGERLIRAGEFRGWAPTMLLGRELRGRTLGVLGYGRIGRAVARRAEGFGMRVFFTARGGGVPFDELLQESDVLSIHCPLNAQTRHLIGAAELLRMKRGAMLVNTARGPIGGIGRRARVRIPGRGGTGRLRERARGPPRAAQPRRRGPAPSPGKRYAGNPPEHGPDCAGAGRAGTAGRTPYHRGERGRPAMKSFDARRDKRVLIKVIREYCESGGNRARPARTLPRCAR